MNSRVVQNYFFLYGATIPLFWGINYVGLEKCNGKVIILVEAFPTNNCFISFIIEKISAIPYNVCGYWEFVPAATVLRGHFYSDLSLELSQPLV